jgi:hypothetical protein
MKWPREGAVVEMERYYAEYAVGQSGYLISDDVIPDEIRKLASRLLLLN